MNDMTWFTLLSTVVGLAAITLGVIFPALAMGRAITQALDALARPHAVHRPGDDRVARNLCAGGGADRAVPKSVAAISFEIGAR